MEERTKEEKEYVCDSCGYEGPEEEGVVCPDCGVGEMASKEDLEEEGEEDKEGLEDMDIKDLGEGPDEDGDLE